MRHNKEPHDIYKEMNVINKIKIRLLRCAEDGREICTEEDIRWRILQH